jgi:hypothetical protein
MIDKPKNALRLCLGALLVVATIVSSPRVFGGIILETPTSPTELSSSTWLSTELSSLKGNLPQQLETLPAPDSPFITDGWNGAVAQNIGPVPEPTTIIAGALLLLPFGASALRTFSRKQAV